MSDDDVREMVRQVIREELASLAPGDLPIYRVLARRREDMGKTQEDAARELGVSVSSIQAWEVGRLPMWQATRYAAWLGLQIVVVPGK